MFCTARLDHHREQGGTMKRRIQASAVMLACALLAIGTACSKATPQSATGSPPATISKVTAPASSVDGELNTIGTELSGVDSDFSTANSELSASQEGDVPS
jgi:hypothetical protein